MEITVSHDERTFNRATRKNETREVVEGKVHIDWKIEKAMRELAPKYRCGVADLVKLALSYYFGDGVDHLYCEHCDMYEVVFCKEMEICVLEEPGTKTTVPVLD